jgi:hypothetical protein
VELEGPRLIAGASAPFQKKKVEVSKDVVV